MFLRKDGMALHRLSLFTLLLLLATFVLVSVRADVPKTPTGKAPLELLVHDLRAPSLSSLLPISFVKRCRLPR